MIEVGAFVIAGDWDDTPTPAGKIRIIIPPLGPTVSGCGWEPFTQAALIELAKHVAPGISVADVGAGSGILSVAAAKLGARWCVATEMSPDALAAMPRVFEANGVSVGIVSGTIPPERVDVAIVSISSQFWQDHRHLIQADKVLVVQDDFSVQVI
jgi:ribosomal protein L11 methylase PrmA